MISFMISVLPKPCVCGASSRCTMTSRCWNAMTVQPKACLAVQVRKLKPP